MNGAIDVGGVAACDTPEDIGGRKSGVVEEVADIPFAYTEISEAVKKYGAGSISWSGPSGDIVDPSGRRLNFCEKTA